MQKLLKPLEVQYLKGNGEILASFARYWGDIEERKAKALTLLGSLKKRIKAFEWVFSRVKTEQTRRSRD